MGMGFGCKRRTGGLGISLSLNDKGEINRAGETGAGSRDDDGIGSVGGDGNLTGRRNGRAGRELTSCSAACGEEKTAEQHQAGETREPCPAQGEEAEGQQYGEPQGTASTGMVGESK